MLPSHSPTNGFPGVVCAVAIIAAVGIATAKAVFRRSTPHPVFIEHLLAMCFFVW